MLTDAALSALLLELYGCALRPEQWPALLARLCTLVDTPQAALVHHQVIDSEFIVAAVSHGTDPEGMAVYNQHYGTIDPWTRAYQQRGGLVRGSRAVTTSDELLPYREFQRTEFCADFGLPFNMVHNVMVVTVPEDGESATTLTFPTGAQDKEHSPSTLDALRFMAPHLQQALVLGGALGGAERRVGELMAALNAPSESTALIAPDATLIFLNAGRRELTAPGQPLCVERRCLKFRSPKYDAAFRRALHGFSRWGEGLLAPVTAAIPFRAAGSTGQKTLTLSPVPAPDGSSPYVVVVRVVDPAAATERRVAATLGAWDLTPTEARITRLLAAGKTVSQIATVTRTRQATVRWHLKQVFAKTGTRTQAQLVALLHA